MSKRRDTETRNFSDMAANAIAQIREVDVDRNFIQ